MEASSEMSEKTLAVLDMLLAGPAREDTLDQALSDAFAAAGELCSEQLDVLTETPVLVELVSAELTSADQFPDPVNIGVAARLTSEIWSETGLLTMDRACLSSVIEVLLGGLCATPNTILDRQPTTLEQELVKIFLSQVMASLYECLHMVEADRPQLHLHDEIQPEEHIGAAEQFVTVSYRLEANQLKGNFSLHLSSAVADILCDDLLTALAQGAEAPDPNWSRQMQAEINQASVSLTAILDQYQMPLSDISKFEVGQFIPLETTPETPVLVHCDGEPLMECIFGQSNGVYTLKVDEFIGPKPHLNPAT